MYELVLKNARLIDPETALDCVMDLAVENGKIVCIDSGLSGKRELNGTGLIAAPGFIDIHAHEDTLNHNGLGLAMPFETAAAALREGVTTIVTGNCGMCTLPAAAYAHALNETPPAVHCPFLCGNVSLRFAVGLDNYTPASEAQIAQMVALENDCFDAGALGISFGLQYAPGTSRAELSALAAVAAQRGGYMAVHMRYDFPEKALSAVREVLDVAEATGVPLQISHLAANVYGGDTLDQAIAMIEASSADVTCDVYPYNVWATSIQSAVFDDGFDHFNFTATDLELLTGPYAGQYCTSALFDELRRAPQDTHVACHNAMPIEDVEKAYVQPFVFFGSDAQLTRDAAGQLKGHPRGSSAAIKFLTEFVRDKQLMSLSQGLAKLTCLPAKRAKLATKGRLQPGMDADIVLFSLGELKVNATFGVGVCGAAPSGIRAVLLDGRIAYESTM